MNLQRQYEKITFEIEKLKNQRDRIAIDLAVENARFRVGDIVAYGARGSLARIVAPYFAFPSDVVHGNVSYHALRVLKSGRSGARIKIPYYHDIEKHPS